MGLGRLRRHRYLHLDGGVVGVPVMTPTLRAARQNALDALDKLLAVQVPDRIYKGLALLDVAEAATRMAQGIAEREIKSRENVD